jgi:hypothetical protein
MFLRIKHIVLSTVVFAATASLMAHADSDFVTGSGALTASPKLDFQVIIPRFIRFQVGSTTAGSVDLVQFDMTNAAASVGSGDYVTRTNGGNVPVLLQSNDGNISLVSSTTGALDNGAGNNISFNEIVPSSSNVALSSPTLVDAGSSAPVVITPNVNSKVIDQAADWSFAYSNSSLVAAGSYGGVNVKNGRVTYTASLP